MVSKKIIALRKSKRWSVRELAEKVGVSHETIYTYERGIVPKLKYLKKIADVYGVSIDSIVYGKARPPKKIETFDEFKRYSAVTAKKERDKIIHYLRRTEAKKK